MVDVAKTIHLTINGRPVLASPGETVYQAGLQRVLDLVIGTMIKRLSGGRSDGVVVLAEGLIEILDPQDLGGLDHVERDEHGHLRLVDVDIGDVLRREVTKGMKALGLATSIVAKNVGYELRCTDPIPFDMEYTRDLGYCAAQFLLDGGTAAMVSIQNGPKPAGAARP